MPNNNPNVLLLGNGINRLFNNDSWENFLDNLSKNDVLKANELSCPEPMKAIILTNDKIDISLKEEKNKLFGKTNKEYRDLAQKILDIGFDDILTTNYSYELEMSALDIDEISEYKLKSLNNHTKTVKQCEPKYLIHTYNQVCHNGKTNRIWHIHGEARKHNSMILGHYYYGSLLSRIFSYNKTRGNYYAQCEKNNKQVYFRSWIDSFILGNVYILGFGYSLSEIDLWWLINRKKREKANHGSVYYFNIYEDELNKDLKKMLEVMEVNIINKKVDNNNWKGAYKNAVDEIYSKINNSR